MTCLGAKNTLGNSHNLNLLKIKKSFRTISNAFVYMVAKELCPIFFGGVGMAAFSYAYWIEKYNDAENVFINPDIEQAFLVKKHAVKFLIKVGVLCSLFVFLPSMLYNYSAT